MAEIYAPTTVTLHPETARVRRIRNKIAPFYDRIMAIFEPILFAGGRDWVCSRATGQVLEINVATGRNLRYYPEDVTLTGIELSPAMAARASDRAKDIGRQIELHEGDMQALPFADDTFDTVVCTLALCEVPDDRRSVQEVKRVLRPGGRFVLLEHVRSPHVLVRLVQRLWNVVSERLEGDHWLREPVWHLQAEGFEVLELERSRLGIVERVAARKPAK